MSPNDPVTCPECRDSGYMRVVRGATAGVAVCHCRTEKLARKAQFRGGEGPWPLPEILRNETLETFRVTGVTPSVREALRGAEKFAADPVGGILFTGRAGVGKSHLAAGILEAANIEAHFVEVPALMAKLRGTFNAAGESDTAIIDELARVPLLVLDDLGAERHTKYSEESIYLIVHKRYAARKPLIITTNKQVVEGAEGEMLIDFVGERTFDRAMGICWRRVDGRLNWFNMTGDSKRWGK